jgi:hypothetical protein
MCAVKQNVKPAKKADRDLSRAYGRALNRSMKYWLIWNDLFEQGKGDSKEAIEAREKYLQAEAEMADICSPSNYPSADGAPGD